MIDKTFQTDRDVSDFVEGRRPRQSRRSQAGKQQRQGTRPNSRSSSESASAGQAELMEAISSIEAQLQALSDGADDLYQEEAYAPPQAPRPATPQRGRRGAEDRLQGSRADGRGNQRGQKGGEDRGYQSSLERIEAQLARVDRALHGRPQNQPNHMPAPEQGSGRAPMRRLASSLYRDDYDQGARSGRDQDIKMGLQSAIQQIVERAEMLNDNLSQTTQRSVEDMRNSLQSGMDEGLKLLRDDVSSLRQLLEEANFSGASEQLLNEIAALSGRIDTLSHTLSETRRDPDVLDTLRDIHALLDRPAHDPSINQHFDRILDKLDHLPMAGQQEGFDRLSAQMDRLKESLSGGEQGQNLSQMSQQLEMMVERLGTLEDNVRNAQSPGGRNAPASQLEDRLASLQDMIGRLDPNDRLMRLEDQLASLADRLEHDQGGQNLLTPLETLNEQVGKLSHLIETRGSGNDRSLLEMLSDRVGELDTHVQRHLQQQNQFQPEQRFDQVEQTLARIDDMLAKRMQTTDLSQLEKSLSRLADHIEAREAAPAAASNVDLSALSSLETQIAALADRLDDASQNPMDHESFAALTERLDALAEQFALSQSRFDAVDRIGADIKQLANAKPRPPINEAKLAEAAAMRALKQVGPLSASSDDMAIDALMDGLKDDLHGLRQLAERREDSTQQSLSSVTDMLNVIVERLGTLEDEVRAGEMAGTDMPPVSVASAMQAVKDNGDEAPRGLGRLLRRRKDEGVTEASSRTQPLSAAELLANRGGSRMQNDQAEASQPAAPDAPQPGDRAPRISLSGKAASARNERGRMPEQPREAPRGPSRTPQGNPGDAAAAVASARSRMTGAQNEPQTSRRAGGSDQPDMGRFTTASQGNAALQTQPEEAPAKPRTARIVDQGRAPQAAPDARPAAGSKADFIAAARRAAQAAAQESQRVEQEQATQSKGFLSRFKGSKKPEQAEKTRDEALSLPGDEPSAEALLSRMNRKERRAAVAEAARKAKQTKDHHDLPRDGVDDAQGTLVDAMLEDEVIKQGLLRRLGGSLSRHSRPLLMAAAAILLALTTLQLIRNPDSSLHQLFNASDNAGEQTAPAGTPQMQSGAKEQSSVTTPSSGMLGPRLEGEDAKRQIAFSAPGTIAAPSVAPPMAGPRVTDKLDSGALPDSLPGTLPGAGGDQRRHRPDADQFHRKNPERRDRGRAAGQHGPGA